MLTLDGNPVADESDYRAYCLAYIPWLHYLDYERIEPGEVSHTSTFDRWSRDALLLTGGGKVSI